MPSRQYDIEAEQVIPEGYWPGEAMDIPNDRPALEAFMLDMAAILQQVGGTLSIVALRREVAPDLFVPVGFRAKWDTYAPAQRLPREEERPAPTPEAPAPEPEPEPAPEDIGPSPEPEVAIEEPEDDGLFDDDFGPDAERALAAAEQG